MPDAGMIKVQKLVERRFQLHCSTLSPFDKKIRQIVYLCIIYFYLMNYLGIFQNFTVDMAESADT